MTTFDEPRLDHHGQCISWRSNDATDCDCRDDHGYAPPTCWADGRMTPFDLETTGPDPLTARIVTATIIDIRPPKSPIITDWLSDVAGEEIPDEAAAIHGVTTDYARAHGKALLDVVKQVIGALQFSFECRVPVVGHNIPYDLTVVACEAIRFGLDPFEVTGPVVDTIVLDRGVDKYRRGSRKLIDTAKHYGVPLTEEDAHGSAADALASARIAWKIAKKYPDVGGMSLAALQTWQAERHRAWAENFGAYLIKQGKTDDVSREWPLRGSA